MDVNKRMSGFLIHGFAVAHAATAFALAQTVVGDEIALTALTIAMIISVAKVNRAQWNHAEALAFFGVFVGGYVGTRGAVFLVKWVPFLGNGINAAVTFTTTEALGGATYLFVSKGLKDPSTLSEEEGKNLWEQAKIVRDAEKDESEKLYESMSQEDKKEFERIMKELKREDLPDDDKDYYRGKLERLTQKYV